MADVQLHYTMHALVMCNMTVLIIVCLWMSAKLRTWLWTWGRGSRTTTRGDAGVESVSNFKYLEVIHIAEDETWIHHIYTLVNKARKQLSHLRLLMKFSPVFLRTLYTDAIGFLPQCGTETAQHRTTEPWRELCFLVSEWHLLFLFLPLTFFLFILMFHLRMTFLTLFLFICTV